MMAEPMMADAGDGARSPRVVRRTDAAGRTLPGQVISPPPLTADAAAAEQRTRQRVAREHAASMVAQRTVARPLTMVHTAPEPSKPRPRERRSSTRASRAGPSGDDDSGPPPPPRPRCSFCGTQLGEVCWSQQLGEWCCRRCYARQAPPDPPASAGDRRREAVHRSIREHDRRETERGRRLRTGWEIVVGVGGLLGRAGLPVEYVGLPGHVGSLCPLCGAGLHIEDKEIGVALECSSGCQERAIAQAIGMGGWR